jgi:hypothetical protein
MANRKFTLQKRFTSRHDYSHARTFGLGAAALPDELLFLTQILDQGNSEKCTAYSAVAVRQSMKAVAYDPDIQWQEELKEMGLISANGSDIKTQMATGKDLGFTPVDSQTRQDNATAYFWVTTGGGLDLFDAIRQTVNQIQAPLTAGLTWYENWNAPILQGVVPDNYGIVLGGHAIKIAGWKTINGYPYLVIQNSWGTGVGDNGLFYFSREVTNKVFGHYGIAYWSDLPTDTVIHKMQLLAALLENLKMLYQSLVDNLRLGASRYGKLKGMTKLHWILIGVVAVAILTIGVFANSYVQTTQTKIKDLQMAMVTSTQAYNYLLGCVNAGICPTAEQIQNTLNAKK